MDHLQHTSHLTQPRYTGEQSGICLSELFEAQADLRPAATALVCGKASLTYSELDCRANKLARYLRNLGAGPETFVALYFDRTLHPIIAILACMKSGAAYVPIDPSYPEDRISHILAESQALLVLSDGAYAEKARKIFPGKVIDLDSESTAIEKNSPFRLSQMGFYFAPQTLAYVIYTSGSTGRPKGVMAEHGSVYRYVQAFNEVCGTRPNDRVFQGFSLAFDGSVEEIWMAFSNGSALIVGDRFTPRFGNELGQFLAEHEITYFSTVPTMLSTITDPVPSLKTLVVSGEICPPELVNRWARPGLRMLNVYGPTEATVNTTAAECRPGRRVTIGRPLRGYDLHILDSEMKPVKEGEPGELYIAGETLARGYLKQPELTNERFIMAPPWLALPHKRLYRTGDRVQRNPNGELEFFGRVDGQVKIRGYRVELSEIESLLLEDEQIRSASVKLVETNGLQALAAFVLLKDPPRPLDRDGVLLRLESRLPHYMVPGFLDVLDELPMLTSGKADRARLPDPIEPLVRAREIVPPSNEFESLLAKVWAELFKIPQVSVESDFFLDLGGHSLVAAQMVTRVRAETKRRLTVRDAYSYPTIKKLASRLSELPTPAVLRLARNGDEKIEPAPGPVQQLSALLQFILSSILYGIGILPLTLLYLLNTEWYSGRLTFPEVLLLATALQLLIFPAMLLLSIAAKWTIIGRYKPGRYPLWGFFHLRWWFVTRLHAMSGASMLAGSPLMSLYFRLMGAQIGQGCTIDTPHCGAWDLVSIGNESSIGTDSQLLGYRVEKGMLILGSVTLGKRCFVGIHSALGLNVTMEDDAVLGDQSLLPDGHRILQGAMKQGSPARTAQVEVPASRLSSRLSNDTPHRHPIGLAIAHFMAIQALILLLMLPAISASLLLVLSYQSGNSLGLLTLFASVPAGFISYCLYFALLKRMILPRLAPGTYSISSLIYLRKWTSDLLMRLSRGMLLPLYTTLFFPPWLRLMGAKVGVRAEISTVWNLSPELVDIGSESFFADGSIIGGKRVYRDRFEVAMNRIGRRTFVGNSAVLPVGSHLGDGSLLGVQSLSPEGCPDDGTEWLGSPAFPLPFRPKETRFTDSVTFQPTRKLYLQRSVIDALRILIPLYLLLASAIAAFALFHFFMNQFGATIMFAISPIIGLLLGVAVILAVAVIKRLVMGKYKPTVQPLWSMYVWLNEMINGLYEYIMARAMGPFLGTPFAAPALRLIGCRIGRGTFIETTLFSEFDLVEIADSAALNAGAVIQNHLFEDRVMKSSYAKIGRNAAIGNMSIVLYDTEVQAGAIMGPLSLVMKGETIPEQTRWDGIPAAEATGEFNEGPVMTHISVSAA